jgi:hypothetical protein
MVTRRQRRKSDRVLGQLLSDQAHQGVDPVGYGHPDSVAAMPDGMVVANGAITYRRTKTLAAQLAEIGIKPADVTYVALSHTHGESRRQYRAVSVLGRADPGCGVRLGHGGRRQTGVSL